MLKSSMFASICGVTCVLNKCNIPIIIRRKETENYGTKNIVKGYYVEGGVKY